jgi:signal transduction histidine kinase
MYSILDKAGLFLLCMLSLLSLSEGGISVIIFLVTAILSELIQILPSAKRKWLFACYGILCLYLPLFCLMIPVFVYDVLSSGKRWMLLAFPVLLLVGRDAMTEIQIGWILCGAFLATLLQHHAQTAAHLQQEMNRQRDQAEEVRLLLAEKNERILMQQDIEIDMATLRERNRIAREIHDHVGHALTRCLLQVGAVQILNQEDSLKEPLTSIQETLQDAMNNIRSSVHNLHDTAIPLRKLTEECIAPLHDTHTVTLEYTISETVPQTIKQCFAGILKESISNILRHSTADAVTIALREHPAFYQLVIQDNGRCAQIGNTGIGLSGMRERAENLGGMFHATASEKGFRIFVSIPKRGEGGTI